jgi:hypothetical protein
LILLPAPEVADERAINSATNVTIVDIGFSFVEVKWGGFWSGATLGVSFSGPVGVRSGTD